MAKRHYIIYADESDRRGKYFSNFFGGVLLKSEDREIISRFLNAKKADLGLYEELKWQKIDASRQDRYIEFIRYYFEFIAASRLKVRIMFTQNMNVPVGLQKRHHEDQYFILYYQFIKHAFGLAYCNPQALDRVYFSIYPDAIPDTEAKSNVFKDYLQRVTTSSVLRNRNLFIRREDIADVDSKDHVILQGLDIVLGSMNAMLNDVLQQKPEGQRTRGKRTRAKEAVYKAINKEIRSIYPNFNIGVSTGTRNGLSDRWDHPYRHWCFKPSNCVVDRTLGKGKAPA